MSSYKNAMEILVEEEVDRQLKAMSARSASYINRLELAAYALNQLPSLYATSEKGLQYQLQRGRAKFQDQIVQAVQRSLAAIRRDPIRTYVPLQPQQQIQFREMLHQLRLLLRNDKVEFETLPAAIEQALYRAAQQGRAWQAKYGSHSTFPKPSESRSAAVQTRPIPPQPKPPSVPVAPAAKPPQSFPSSRASQGSLGRNTLLKEGVHQSDAWDDPFHRI